MDIKKMKYCGKYMEDFAYSFCSFLKINGINVIDLYDPDCLSLRSMFFLLGDDISMWFRTAIPWHEYMTIIRSNMGFQDSLNIETVEEYARELENISKWIFLGEVPSFYPSGNIQDNFYGRKTANYLIKNEGSYFIIIDSMGNPYRCIQTKKLKEKLKTNVGFVAFFKDKPELSLVTARDIALQARLYYKRKPNYLLKNQAIFFRNNYHGGVRERISLQYGLMNYQLQMNKTIDFFFEAGLLSDSQRREIESKLMSVTSVIKSSDFSIIAEVEELFWDSLEEGILQDEHT